MNFENLFAVRIRFRDRYGDLIDKTIALATTEREAQEAVRKWYRKHKEDEGGWHTDSNIKSSKEYVVYYDAVQSDRTVEDADWRKNAEYAIYDILV